MLCLPHYMVVRRALLASPLYLLTSDQRIYVPFEERKRPERVNKVLSIIPKIKPGSVCSMVLTVRNIIRPVSLSVRLTAIYK